MVESDYLHIEMERRMPVHEKHGNLLRNFIKIRISTLIILFLSLHSGAFDKRDESGARRGEVLIIPRSKNTYCYVNNTYVGQGVTRVINLKPGGYRIIGINGRRRHARDIKVFAGEETHVKLNANRPSLLLSFGLSGVFSSDIILCGYTMDMGFEFPWGYIGLYGGIPFEHIWVSQSKMETYIAKETFSRRAELLKEVSSGGRGTLFGLGIVVQRDKNFAYDNVQLRYGLLTGFWHMLKYEDKDVFHTDGSRAHGESVESDDHYLWGGPCANLTIGSGVPSISFGAKLLVGYCDHQIDQWRGSEKTDRFFSVLPVVDIHMAIRFGKARLFSTHR